MANGWPLPQSPDADANLQSIELLLSQTFDTPSPPDAPNPSNPQRVATKHAVDKCRGHDPTSPGPPPYDLVAHEMFVAQALVDATAASAQGPNPPPGTWTAVINDLNHGGGGGSGGPPSVADLAVMTRSIFGHGLGGVKWEQVMEKIRDWTRKHWPGYPIGPVPTPQRLKEIRAEIARRETSGVRGGFPLH
jgi:hypothetical protein